MARGLHLELDEGELTHLLPMVQDLLDVAQKLRHEQRAGIEPPDPRGRVTPPSG